MGDRPVYAHTFSDSGPKEWQRLGDHLQGVADRAAQFAAAFDAAAWGELAGLWHDLGKFQPDFQQRLHGEKIAVEHSGVGAALAVNGDRERGLALAFVLAGHHAGLTNLQKSGAGFPTPLTERLRVNEAALWRMRGEIPAGLLEAELPSLPAFLRPPTRGNRRTLAESCRRMEFWIRFLFSSLVDGDWLDTEEFLDPHTAALRGEFDAVGMLAEKLDEHIDALVESLSPDSRSSPVNLARAEILSACREAAMQAPGVFALTVPTGGGKTLSAMSFALRHARQHGLERVIVVIPYTSIIEQNAETYRDALGAESVIEHHSSFDPARIKEDLSAEATSRHGLAAENWDAPVIVTTSVQFFESLFANRPSRCRKLHNIARSVVILDEVQTVPPRFLLSIVEVLGELVSHYGCSVVLSTATPPALRRRPGFDLGLADTREVVRRPERLSADLKRVGYVWPREDAPAVTWEFLSVELAGYKQVLVVVHRRADARELAELLEARTQEGSVHHLSALMCAAHRSDVLRGLRADLTEGKACLLVSTQLVEAGVDVDFPVVYRAMAGLDSIVQAAGRCNREGRLERGKVVVFRAPTPPPSGTPRKAMETTETLLREAEGELEPDDPALFQTYFRMLYMKEDKDARHIQTDRQEFNFATVARNFRLIEDGFTQTVVVPYGDAPGRLATLRCDGPSREAFRGLQRYVVSIYPKAFEELSRAGALEEITDGMFALAPGYGHLYDGRFGLTVGDIAPDSAGELVV